jgi:hypothetical protein
MWLAILGVRYFHAGQFLDRLGFDFDYLSRLYRLDVGIRVYFKQTDFARRRGVHENY